MANVVKDPTSAGCYNCYNHKIMRNGEEVIQLVDFVAEIAVCAREASGCYGHAVVRQVCPRRRLHWLSEVPRCRGGESHDQVSQQRNSREDLCFLFNAVES